MGQHYTVGVLIAISILFAGISASAQTHDSKVALTVVAGRPIEVVFDERVSIKSVGQPVAGTLVEPLYAYDRIVVPAGTRVLGHVAALDAQSKVVRTRAILNGDLTPARHIVLQFDSLVLADGSPVPIQTRVKTEMPHLKRTRAPAPTEDAGHGGVVGRAEREAKNQIKASVSAAEQNGRYILAEITEPGRTERLKEALVDHLPYHPQFIGAGTGYHAELLAPLDFGRVTPTAAATIDVRPAPDSTINARLVTTLDSSKTPRGTKIRAVLTQPLFSDDHRLILPEGTTIDGEVTVAVPARSFHRNGQLRFLFESVHVPDREPSPLLASLQSVQTSGDAGVAIDDEGGAKTVESKTRFVAPALALLALRGNLDRHDHLDPDGDGHVIHSSNQTSLTVGGFFGLGLLGIPLSHMAPPLGVALSAFGAARSLYRNVFARGRDVQFPEDTLIQLQLAPGPSEQR